MRNTHIGTFLASATSSVTALIVAAGFAAADQASHAPAPGSEEPASSATLSSPGDDAPGAEVAAGENEGDWIRANKQAAAKDVARELADTVDPVSAEEVARLDKFGVLTRQKEIGEDILIIDRELKRAESISKLIDYMGIDGFRTSFPELYGMMENSPVILRAKIKSQELHNDLEVAMAGPDIDEDRSRPEESRARDDGSSFFEMPVAPPAESAGSSPVEETVEEMVRNLKARTSDEDLRRILGLDAARQGKPAVPISLREVYGVDGDFYAIITHGDERIRVSPGDELPGDTKILSISTDYIDVSRGDRELRIRIRG